jgi:hypothetical protein
MRRDTNAAATIVVVLAAAYLVFAYVMSATVLHLLGVLYLVGAGLIAGGLVLWLRGRRADARLALLVAGACGLLPMWPYGVACVGLGLVEQQRPAQGRPGVRSVPGQLEPHLRIGTLQPQG